MSDAADIFGQPVADPDEARESFLAGGAGTFPGGDIGGVFLRLDDLHLPIAQQRGCDFSHGHCQLGFGHAPPHCVPDPDGSGSYLMVDADGWVLREL